MSLEGNSNIVFAGLLGMALLAIGSQIRTAPSGEEFRLVSGASLERNESRDGVRIIGQLTRVNINPTSAIGGTLEMLADDGIRFTVLANIPSNRLQELSINASYEVRGNHVSPGTISLRSSSNISPVAGITSNATITPISLHRETNTAGTARTLEHGLVNINASFPLEHNVTYRGYWSTPASGRGLPTFTATQIIN